MTTDNDAPAAGLVERIMRQIEDVMIDAEVDYPAGREAGPRVSYDDDAIRNYIFAALQAPQEAGVAVKALEWNREAPTQWQSETWKAESLVGEYDIQREKDGTFSGFAPNAGTDLFGTLEAAKAAAQADFDKRIRSALSQPVATPAPHGDYWHSINTAPEDEHVILATSGDHVGEALMLRDQDTGEQKWTWAGAPVSKFHTPLGWRPMPSPIRFAVPDDNRSGGFDGPTGAE